MNAIESHSQAQEIAAQLFNCEVGSLHKVMRQSGFEFTYRDGQPIINPARRIDSYNVEDVEAYWRYLPLYVRVYFDALAHTGDVNQMSERYKIDAIQAWADFQHTALQTKSSPDSFSYEDDAISKTLDGAYLHRIGFRVFVSKSHAIQDGYTLPDDREWLYTVEHDYNNAGGLPKMVLMGLYRIENSGDGELSTVLHDVISAGEAADIYGVDAGTIRVSIHKGYIPARKSGGTWLLARSDAEKRWGSA